MHGKPRDTVYRDTRQTVTVNCSAVQYSAVQCSGYCRAVQCSGVVLSYYTGWVIKINRIRSSLKVYCFLVSVWLNQKMFQIQCI